MSATVAAPNDGDDRVIAGIAVGGESRRMGTPKGLIEVRGKPIVQHVADALASIGAQAFLVGYRPEYAEIALPTLRDEPAGIGPLGGLRALLCEAQRSGARAILVGCDMPLLTSEVLARLARPPGPGVWAAEREGRWEPLFSTWQGHALREAADEAIQQRRYSLQELLVRRDARVLPLSASELSLLEDWDTPADIRQI